MFDAPLDSWYVWIALALTSVATVGAAGTLPTAPPPDAAALANTVDRVAAAAPGTVAEHPLDADAVELGPGRVGLRNGAGTVHARFVADSVVPVPDGSPLQEVVFGTPPEAAFDSGRAFEDAVVDARTRERSWETVDRTVVVRRVSWEGSDVTLVDA